MKALLSPACGAEYQTGNPFNICLLYTGLQMNRMICFNRTSIKWLAGCPTRNNYYRKSEERYHVSSRMVSLYWWNYFIFLPWSHQESLSKSYCVFYTTRQSRAWIRFVSAMMTSWIGCGIGTRNAMNPALSWTPQCHAIRSSAAPTDRKEF